MNIATTPNEIFIERPAVHGVRSFVRLRKGDTLREGDRPGGGLTLSSWRITAITPDIVAARDHRTDRSVAWPRRWIETQLSTGALTTDPTDFVRVRVLTVPDRSNRGSHRLKIVADGDDGRRYVRYYHLGSDGRARFDAESESVAALSGLIYRLLDGESRRALAVGGYELAD